MLGDRAGAAALYWATDPFDNPDLEKFYRDFVRKYAKEPQKISDFFIHVVCRTGWQYVFEVVSHDIPYEEAQGFMKSIREYSFAGWKRVME